LPTAIRQHHHERQRDPDDGAHDVKGERDGHLRAGRQQVWHAYKLHGCYFSLAMRSSTARLFENSPAIACSVAFAVAVISAAASAAARSNPTRMRRTRRSTAGVHAFG